MKSFNKFINEAKKDLPAGNPGNLTASDIEKFKNVVNTGKRPENLSTDAYSGGRKKQDQVQVHHGKVIRKQLNMQKI